MVRLDKLLAEKSKIRRGRRILLNIHITFLAWIVELIGFIVGFIGLLLQHKTNGPRFLRNITGVFYFILVPSTYLINSSNVKSLILDNKLYLTFINKFLPNSLIMLPPDNNANIEKPQDSIKRNSRQNNLKTELPKYWYNWQYKFDNKGI